MGRTPTPLVIWVAREWQDRPEIVALKEKGHVVQPIVAVSQDPDLILHPAAHAWTEAMFSNTLYLDVALRHARARKKETG